MRRSLMISSSGFNKVDFNARAERLLIDQLYLTVKLMKGPQEMVAVNGWLISYYASRFSLL